MGRAASNARGTADRPVSPRPKNAARPSADSKAAPPSKGKIGVFISYPHEDGRIATALRQSLSAISDDLKIFIDHAGLVSGDDYEPTLARNIASSQWFLMICSGPPRPERDMGYCFLEAGQFRAKLLSEGKKNDFIQSRLVTIHDDHRPRPISKFQSTRIGPQTRVGKKLDLTTASNDLSPFEDTDAFKLFEDIISYSTSRPLRNMSEAIVRDLVREQARRLIRAFIENGGDPALPEIVLQPRISFYLPFEASVTRTALTDDSVITGIDTSLKDVFGILGSETTWGKSNKE